MRSSIIGLLTLLLVVFAGCGTFSNLKDSPNGPVYFGTGACYPFGGVTRSGLLAVLGPTFGIGDLICVDFAICRGEFDLGFQDLGNGLYETTVGLGAVVDTPFSLAGDFLTYPVAYARSKQYAWASWWGERAVLNPTAATVPAPDGENNKSNSGMQPAD